MANGGIIGPVKCISTPVTKVTSFTASGTFNAATCKSKTAADLLVVAGGGGGGARHAGGGGAGGYRTSTSVLLSQGMTVTVGAGGSGAPGGLPNPRPDGTSGTSSIFGTITSTGGGFGKSAAG